MNPANDVEHYHPNSYPPIEAQSENGSESDMVTIDRQRRLPKVMWPQYLAAFVACLGAFAMGTCIGWSGPALSYLMDNSTQHEFPVTVTDASWIGSLMPAGALFGSKKFVLGYEPSFMSLLRFVRRIFGRRFEQKGRHVHFCWPLCSWLRLHRLCEPCIPALYRPFHNGHWLWVNYHLWADIYR